MFRAIQDSRRSLALLVSAGCATVLIVRAIFSAPAIAGDGGASDQKFKVSAFAPAGDLIQQVNFFVARLDESTASRDDFDEARQSRVAKEADVVAVLGVALAEHDEKHALSESAPALVAAARQLASAGGDYAKARATIDALKTAAAGKLPNGTPPPAVAINWKPVAPLGLLMKEVPQLQASLKREVQGEHFEAQAKESAGTAATLAAIAQLTVHDTTAVKDPAQQSKWAAESIEMRDAAGAVNHAIHAKDREATTKALARLSQSCTACHGDFRKSH